MPKLIFRSNYFKNEPAVHRSNYIKYLGTREGVEMNPDTMPRFFYEDQDMHGKKENYIDYISGRPGVALNEGEQHGLFSYPGVKINLEQVMDEVANHKGTVWINVISLKREDARRVGYEKLDTWRNLLWRHVNDVAANFSIKPDNLRWYAAFHNEGHHPHVHMVVYSKNEHEGFLRKNGIKELKSKFTNDIFDDELGHMYSEKSKQRDAIKEQSRQSLLKALQRLEKSNPQNENIELMIKSLGEKLKNIKGKKVYGYLHKNIKQEIDHIADELEKIPEVKECYEKWMEYQRVIAGYYQDELVPHIPLSKNNEFKSIKNMIIQEALKQNHYMDKSSSVAHSVISDDAAKSVGHLAKRIEGIFNNLIGDRKGNNQAVSDSVEHQKEKEKKVALGQKEDDSESSENRKYMSM